MSGLENFHTSEAWRSHLKRLLFMERKPQLAAPSTNIQRYSLDIVEDLKIIEEKRILNSEESTVGGENIEITMDKMLNQRIEDDEDKENAKTLGMHKSCNIDDTLFEHSSMSKWQRTSDESFEALEKMCDKTASDPDSTLFEYLHGDHKEEVLAHAKNRSFESSVEHPKKGYDAETLALQNLLDSLRVEEQRQLENESPLRGIDITQLEDIEAPSRLWENTITGETLLQTSPVKMVGLLRPSTIIEENGEESDASISFQSALKSAGMSLGATSEVSSSCYETANSSINTVQSSASKTDFTKEVNQVEGNKNMEEPAVALDTYKSKEAEHLIDLDESVDLIDLEKTFAPLNNISQFCAFEQTRKSSDSEDSVIEVFSEDEYNDNKGKDNRKDQIDVSVGSAVKKEQVSLISAVGTIDPITSANSSEARSSVSDYESNKEYTYDMNESGADNSQNFDNTMEEVEYMLQKGLEYMATVKDNKTATTAVNVNATQSLEKAQLTATKSEFVLSSPIRPQSPTPKSKNRFEFEIKPFPKLNVFKKPSAIPTSSALRHKELTNKQFSHVISPVATYMKKTGVTPLMSTIKTSNKNADVHNSSAFRQLEYESRLYQPKFDGKSKIGSPAKLPGVPANARTLPKKAYICSEYKHIVDERAPLTIPGGRKIQKYLEPAMRPTVERHEGKLKVCEETGAISKLYAKEQKQTGPTTSTAQGSRRTDLGDLSVISGDVSVHTVMYAQKF